MNPNFAELLPLLTRHNVKYILIGGGAAVAYGSARATQDVDVVYARDDDNIRCLAAALTPHQPYLRGAPPGLPFRWDEATIRAGLNFTLTTALGDIDLLGEVTGGGTYNELVSHTETLELFGVRCVIVTLEKLIRLKRAAGRPKDLEAIAELQAILEQRGGSKPNSGG